MNLRWTPRAYQDAENIFEYLSEENPVAALSILERIESSVEYLKEYPEIGRKGRIPETRELIISDIPYFVVYRIASDTIEILAIYHGAQLFPKTLDS